ncbi:MAG: head maturation protease, ClpP-related [Sulfitobacter sp.]|jgi:ATP-dependent protease ClpP protease subunit
MSLRKLPEIKAFKALSNMEWQPRTDVVDRWNAGIQAATSDEASISILGEIGGGEYGDGVTSKRIAGAMRSIGERDVRVDINSPGGDFFEGVAIYNMLREHKAKITVNVLGLAASAASVIAMAGDEIKVAKTGFLMVHNAWGITIGNRHDMQAAAAMMEPFDRAMRDLYAERSGSKAEDVEAWMDAETFFTGEDAVRTGLADGYLSAAEIEQDKDNGKRASAIAKIEASMAAQGLSRRERRSLLAELQGGADVSPPDVMPSADIIAALRGNTEKLKI